VSRPRKADASARRDTDGGAIDGSRERTQRRESGLDIHIAAVRKRSIEFDSTAHRACAHAQECSFAYLESPTLGVAFEIAQSFLRTWPASLEFTSLVVVRRLDGSPRTMQIGGEPDGLAPLRAPVLESGIRRCRHSDHGAEGCKSERQC
jgi:hypothetical protein